MNIIDSVVILCFDVGNLLGLLLVVKNWIVVLVGLWLMCEGVLVLWSEGLWL